MKLVMIQDCKFTQVLQGYADEDDETASYVVVE